MERVTGDILDLEHAHRAVAAHRPEVVLHLAAQPIVRAAFEDPVGTYATNVHGTATCSRPCASPAASRVVIAVTTDKVYENREWEWGYREDESLGGLDPYASSKACAELVIAAYRQSFFTAERGTPPGQRPRGQRHRRRRLGAGPAPPRPHARRARGQRRCRSATPTPIRPWQHVLNPLDGYLTLAERLWDEPEHAHGWNFGPDAEDDRPVGDIADRLAALWGEGLRWERDSAEHPHEAHYLRLDSSLAKGRLGWQPRWALDDALAAIVQFARVQQRGGDLREVVLRQIEAFERGDTVTADPAPAPPR